MKENGKAKPQRIAVVGTSCSGKTTLADNISKILEIPHFELDVLHWGPNWTSREDFADSVEQAIQNPQWVIDGNYRKVRAKIWEKVNLIIWLNYPFPLVFWRALKRTIPRVIKRETIYAGNRETFRLAFFSSDSILWWVIKTHKMRRKEYSNLFSGNEFSHFKVVELQNPKLADNFLLELKRKNG